VSMKVTKEQFVGITYDELLAENAKLRELVADTLMQPRDYCQKYDIEYDSWDSVNEHLDARLRELGVMCE